MAITQIDCAAIILARSDSSRYPRKALSTIGSKKLVEWSIDAFKDHPSIIPILATTNRAVDDELSDFAHKKGIRVYRGSFEDVALRVCGCLRSFSPKYFARINGDSIFFPIKELENAFDTLKSGSVDFVTNLVPRTYPYGVSVEVFKKNLFLETYARLEENGQKEHITSFFYEHLEEFRVKKLVYPKGNFSHIKVTIDLPEDKPRLEKLINKIESNHQLSVDKLIDLYKNTFTT